MFFFLREFIRHYKFLPRIIFKVRQEILPKVIPTAHPEDSPETFTSSGIFVLVDMRIVPGVSSPCF